MVVNISKVSLLSMEISFEDVRLLEFVGVLRYKVFVTEYDSSKEQKNKNNNKRDGFISDNGLSKELREWKSDGVRTNFIRWWSKGMKNGLGMIF